jgi:hypothetical protein
MRCWLKSGFLLTLFAAGGCASMDSPLGGLFDPLAAPKLIENPLLVPYSNPDVVWNQVVDVVDDYFVIAQEQPVRTAEYVTEGQLLTRPLVGATIFEPWHGDSANAYERLESTLQSIRRTAKVQVTPDPRGFLVRVMVLKEVEDLAQVSPGTGAANFRNDTSLERFPVVEGEHPTDLGWVPLGNDVALEQEILAKLQGRFAICPK